MSFRRRGVHRRTVRSKVDATPPWEEPTLPPAPATTGPYDEADTPDDGIERGDFGALRVPILPGINIQLELISEVPQLVTLSQDGVGAVQLIVCAAPRSNGIWDDLRADLVKSLSAEGGGGQEVAGSFGTEIVGNAVVNGTQVPVRIVGVDGPRWLLRATFYGAPALSSNKSTQLEDAVRKIVVVRGTEPRPVRDSLPLRLPEDMEFQYQPEA